MTMTQEQTAPLKTEDVIRQMLTENTGTHMLDSGGAYGRHHEKNQDRDFSSEPATVLDFSYGGIEVTHSVYHWLIENLEYDQETDAAFHNFAKLEENKDKYWAENVRDFILLESERLEGEPDLTQADTPAYNTYNGEDLLSQTLQYWYVELRDQSYVFLQIHGGCDVRGGYTAPRVFTPLEQYAIMSNAHASIWCENGNDYHRWSTDDAYTWYDGDDEDGGKELGEYEIVKIEDLEKPLKRSVHKNGDLFKEGETTQVHYSHQGVLVIDEKKNIGYCPKCGAQLKGGY